jgi:hypothetical protein
LLAQDKLALALVIKVRARTKVKAQPAAIMAKAKEEEVTMDLALLAQLLLVCQPLLSRHPVQFRPELPVLLHRNRH